MLAPTPTPRRFEGRSVFVTGAGTGFGAEIAVRAATEGARVVGVRYRNSKVGAERTAARVAEAGSEPFPMQVDISSWDQVRTMAEESSGAIDGIDVLVNNVGDVARAQMSWRDLTEDSIDHVIDVDVKGTLFCIHEFDSRMLDRWRGCIVNIGSTVVVRGSARAPQYAAAKYALLGLTKSYAHAFAPTVRANTFAPVCHDSGSRVVTSNRSPAWTACNTDLDIARPQPECGTICCDAGRRSFSAPPRAASAWTVDRRSGTPYTP